MEKKKKEKKDKTVLAIVLAAILTIGGFIVALLIPFVLVMLIFTTAKEELVTDISKYNSVIGKESEEKYNTKWGLNEKIFPKKIKKSYDVKNFKFVYYDPWDANYLAFLEIDYNDEDYEEEKERLEKLGIKNYKGYYGVTGFENYTLLAMDADSYNGFIYAITDGNNKIVYVELQFCNYSMDIDYNKYIPKKYLPDGFDATMDNPYQKAKDKEQGVGNLF